MRNKEAVLPNDLAAVTASARGGATEICQVVFVDHAKKFAFAKSKNFKSIYIRLMSAHWRSLGIEIGGTITCTIKLRERGPEALTPISYAPPAKLAREEVVAWVRMIPRIGPYCLQTLDGRKILLPRNHAAKTAGGGLEKIRLWSVSVEQKGGKLVAVEPPKNLGLSVEATAETLLAEAAVNGVLGPRWAWLLARANSDQDHSALRKLWSDQPHIRDCVGAKWLAREPEKLTDDEVLSITMPGLSSADLTLLLENLIDCGRRMAMESIIDRAYESCTPLTSRSWGRLAIKCSTKTSDTLLRLISVCAKYGWPLDGNGFASFAKAASLLQSPESFSVIVRACAAVGWPLEEGPWVTFIVASAKLNAQDDFRRLLGACIEHLDTFPATVLGLLTSVAVRLGFDAQFAIIISYCQSKGWPLPDNAWSKLIAAAGQSSRADLLPIIVAARRAIGELEERELSACVGAIKSAVRSAARDENTVLLSHLRDLVVDLWRKIRDGLEDIDVFSTFMTAGALLDHKDMLGDGADWLLHRRHFFSEPEPSHTNAVLELAVSLLKADTDPVRVLNIINILPNKAHTPRVELLRSFLIEETAGSGRFGCSGGDVEAVLAAIDGASMRAFLTLAQDDRRLDNEKWIRRLEYLNSLTKTLRNGKDDPYVLLQIGRRYRFEKNFLSAHELFMRAGATDDKKNKSICSYEIGLTYLDEGKWKEALACLRIAIELSGMPLTSQLTKAAEAATNAGEFDQAISWLQDIIRRDPADTRAYVQLAGTLVAGFRQGFFTQAALLNAEMAISDALRSASADKRLARELASLIVSLHDLGRPAGELVIHQPSDATLPVVCEALVAARIWNEGLLGAALSRLFATWPAFDTARPLIRYVAAGLTHAYFSGKLGRESYIDAATHVFSKIISNLSSQSSGLIFEIFVARRDFILREILGEYAKLANIVIYKFLLDLSSGKNLSILKLSLEDINRLLLDELPAQLAPKGYGDSDIVAVEPRLHLFTEKLEARATMFGARTEFSVDSAEGTPTECALMTWMAIRSSIADLMPSNTESPFFAVGQVSVPWKITFTLENNSVRMNLDFPSKIHPNHDPKKLLREAQKRVNAWAYEQRNCSIDSRDWLERQRITVHFLANRSPGNNTLLRNDMSDFVTFLCEENLRVLNGGALSPEFFEHAKNIFSKSYLQASEFCPPDWVHCHQYMLDAHFGVTAEWLFIGETLSERPDYHPRYELHKLKGHVSAAIKQIAQRGTVSNDVIDVLRDKLVRMRKNIYLTLKQMIPNDSADEVITDVVPVVREAIKQVFSGSDIKVTVSSPPAAPAKVGRFSLHSAVFNLLMNAHEAVDRLTGQEVTVKIASDMESTWIQIENLFDPLSEPKEYGTGIGLADTRFHVEEISGGALQAGETEVGVYVARIIFRR